MTFAPTPFNLRQVAHRRGSTPYAAIIPSRPSATNETFFHHPPPFFPANVFFFFFFFFLFFFFFFSFFFFFFFFFFFSSKITRRSFRDSPPPDRIYLSPELEFNSSGLPPDFFFLSETSNFEIWPPRGGFHRIPLTSENPLHNLPLSFNPRLCHNLYTEFVA